MIRISSFWDTLHIMHGKRWNLGILFPGNLCNFEGKFIISMDISVFFLPKILKICKKIKILMQILTFIPGKSRKILTFIPGKFWLLFQGNFAFFPALKSTYKNHFDRYQVDEYQPLVGTTWSVTALECKHQVFLSYKWMRYNESIINESLFAIYIYR